MSEIMTRVRGRTTIWASSVLPLLLVAAVLVIEPFVYVIGGARVAYAEMMPRVIELGPSDSQEETRGLVTGRVGGLITADLDDDGERDFVITGADRITAAAGSGVILWSKEVDIQVTGQAEREGLPGLHAPGAQAADIDCEETTEVLFTERGELSAADAASTEGDERSVANDAPTVGDEFSTVDDPSGPDRPAAGLPAPPADDMDCDGAAEVLFLTRSGALSVVDGASGVERASVSLPAPPAEAERWEHLIVADFRGRGDRDLLLQATNEAGYRMGRFLAAYALDELLRDGEAATPLWERSDFLANAHNGARIADLDGDGRHEVLGGDIIGPDGERLFRLSTEGHLDSLFVADVRPDLPGLEVVALEEGGPQRTFLYNHNGLIWEAHHEHQEPQNAALGDFDADRPGLEIWCRSRYARDQRPWVFDARGEVIASYEMADVAPKGWTVKGVEEIFTIHWTGEPEPLAAAKERHVSGDVALFDPLSGTFVLRLEEEADRLYVADVSGDWREEIIVLNGGELHIYENPAPNPDPDRPSLWDQDHYRRSKLTWNYYSP